MEIIIAVVRMKEKIMDKINSNAFEVLLVNEPCSSSRHEIRMQLPRCHVSPNDDPAETALSFIQYHCRLVFFFLIHVNMLPLIFSKIFLRHYQRYQF